LLILALFPKQTQALLEPPRADVKPRSLDRFVSLLQALGAVRAEPHAFRVAPGGESTSRRWTRFVACRLRLPAYELTSYARLVTEKGRFRSRHGDDCTRQAAHQKHYLKDQSRVVRGGRAWTRNPSPRPQTPNLAASAAIENILPASAYAPAL